MADNTTNQITRYSDADLAEFKVILDKKLAKAQEELKYYEEQILEITANSGDDHGGDWMDDSNTNNDMEFLNDMAIRQRKLINDLQNALVRIENKSYGICVVTGELIDKRRLKVQPIATKSVAVKNARPKPAPKHNRSIK